MRPVARRRLSAGQAVFLGVVGVVLGLALLIGFSYLASDGTIDVNLGDQEFNAGRVDSIADAIERDGPAFYRDAAGGSKDIWLQHLGDDDETGWYAVAARTRPDCTVTWDGVGFVDCDAEEYPPDGSGLTRYVVRVDDERLYVDLNDTR